MSKSFKKTPIIKYAGYGAYGKKLANRKVRRTHNEIFTKGNLYRRMYQTWNINDCISHWPQKEAEKSGKTDVWEKFYHRK